MTAVPVTERPNRRPDAVAAARLVRIELRRNALRWILPLIAVLFWFVVYRRVMATPHMWNIRGMGMQTAAVSVFAPIVVGVGAWTGSRDGRHAMTDLLACTARPRWWRQIAAWAAVSGWAVAAYLVCVGAVYAATAVQGAGGGPLWWPVVVGAASQPAFAALGFAFGAWRPSRFTTPLVAIAVFFALEFSGQFIHGYGSPWQIAPLVAGPWNIGPDQGVGTFYRYLPDLPIAQVMFVAGLTGAALGLLGLPARAGGARLRRGAATLAVVGVLLAGTATALAGTGRLDPHGLIAIPALHDAADDRPVEYTPVCGDAPIPVCLHPAYAGYLPTVVSALRPILTEVAGLPGAPVRITQVAATYLGGAGNGVDIRGSDGMTGSPPVFDLVLPNQLPGPTMSPDDLGPRIAGNAGRAILTSVVAPGRDLSAAQQAVIDAITNTALTPDPGIAAAAARFAALPLTTRHAWLMANLAALRDGSITLGQMP